MPKRKAAPGALQSQPKKPNKFEQKVSKQKFDILGRKVSKGNKNILKARQDAVAKRNNTLLVEYRQLRKSNLFVDRRFGEDDQLGEDDKALVRFQTERLRQGKKKGGGAAKFTLSEHAEERGGADGETLTHLGTSLAELRNLGEMPDTGDLDDEEVAALMDEYNFGGGGDGAGSSAVGADGQRKTKKQVMEEIIAKSKAAKAAKVRQHEEDEEAIEKLDDTFKALTSSATLQVLLKPAGFNKTIKLKADTESDAQYDRAARELVFEAKARAGERTMTPEELEAKERERLEKLEKERLQRMTATAGRAGVGGDDNGSDDEAAAAVGAAGGGREGGYAARRKRQRQDTVSGDALDENFDLGSEREDGSGTEGEDESGSDEDDMTALDSRRRKRAAGEHPLQDSFRQQAAALLKKHGLDLGRGGDDEDSDGDEDGSGSDDEEGGEGSSGGSGSQSAESEDVDTDEGSQGDGESPDDHEEFDEKGASAAAAAAAAAAAPAADSRQAQQRRESGKHASMPTADVDAELPFTIPLPASYEAFAALVQDRSAADLVTVVTRIRAFNSSTLAAENKRKLQVFYGMLVQHFASLAGSSPLPVAHLDALLPLLLQMTGEVPFYATTVARARLKKLHERLQQHLTQPADAPLHGWPGPRAFLQLKLFATLFPVSDRRHPVTSPLMLLLGKMLQHCPITNLQEAASAALAAGLMLHVVGPAKRYSPELVMLLPQLLAACAALPAGGGAEPAPDHSAVAPDVLALPKLPSKQRGAQISPPSIYALLQGCFGTSADGGGPTHAASASKHEATAKLQLLHALLCMAQRMATLYSELDCYPQVFAPLLRALQQLQQRADRLPASLATQLSGLLQQVQERSAAVVATRVPVTQAFRVRARPVKEYNPRFEEGYVAGRDYDIDSQRAANKRLRREVVREKRGAMRELRKDAAFMAGARDAELAQVDSERLASERRFYAELQGFQADFKSGGQGGMNPHLKNKGKRRK